MGKAKLSNEPEREIARPQELAYPLIRQGLKDTSFWLSIRGSAEEKIYIRRSQRLLNDLACMCERNPNFYPPPSNDQDWNKVLQELLAAIMVAGNARGRILGKALPRLAELLAPEHQKQTTKNANDHLAKIEAFLDRVNQEAGERITKSDIWRVAGYKGPTEFQRYQRNDARTTVSAKSRFDALLTVNPTEFIRRLQAKAKRR